MNSFISTNQVEDTRFLMTHNVDASKSSIDFLETDQCTTFNRKKTVMRSMYVCSSSKHATKLNDRFNDDTEMQARKISLDRREFQLNIVADEAIRQVEEMLRLKNCVIEFTQENCQLKDEVIKLREAFNEAVSEMKDKKDAVKEWKEYQSQLQGQLEWNRRKLAQYRLQNERIKADKHVVMNNIAPNLMEINAVPEVDEHEISELRQECDDIAKQIKNVNAEIDRLQKINMDICSLMREEADEAADNQRKINDLLRVLRLSSGEKMVWQHYSTRVLSKIVSDAPELLEINCRSVDSAFHCGHMRSMWQDYTLTLLKTLVEYSPSLAGTLLEKEVSTPQYSSLSNTKSFKDKNGQLIYHVPHHLTVSNV